MEKTKWVLPSVEMWRTAIDRMRQDDSLTSDAIKIGELLGCHSQCKSDLTDALDLLESLHRKFPTKSINDFLIKFRQPK